MLLFDPSEPFDPYRDDIPTIPVSLRANINIFDQLSKDLIPGTQCSIGLVFRVNTRRKKVKQVINYIDYQQTADKILGFKRGHLPV